MQDIHELISSLVLLLSLFFYFASPSSQRVRIALFTRPAKTRVKTRSGSAVEIGIRGRSAKEIGIRVRSAKESAREGIPGLLDWRVTFVKKAAIRVSSAKRGSARGGLGMASRKASPDCLMTRLLVWFSEVYSLRQVSTMSLWGGTASENVRRRPII